MCILIEKYLFPIKSYLFIKQFLIELKKLYNLVIYIPEVSVIKIDKSKVNDILDYLNNFFIISKNINDHEKFNCLIIFSEYDKNVFFDRRELIVKSINYDKLIILNSYNLNSNETIKEVYSYNLFKNQNYPTIFEYYDNDTYFLKKFNIDFNKQIIGLSINTNLSKNEHNLIVEYSKKFIILSLKNIYLDYLKDIIIFIPDIHFNNLLNYSSFFIIKNSLDTDIIFLTKKIIIELNNTRNYKIIKKHLQNDDIITNINYIVNIKNNINYLK